MVPPLVLEVYLELSPPRQRPVVSLALNLLLGLQQGACLETSLLSLLRRREGQEVDCLDSPNSSNSNNRRLRLEVHPLQRELATKASHVTYANL